MAHTHNQDLENHLNALPSDISMTQKEMRQINANISTINSSMHSTIDAKMEDMKHDMKQDINAHITTNLNILLPRSWNY
jgi:prefoldin subunit 5